MPDQNSLTEASHPRTDQSGLTAATGVPPRLAFAAFQRTRQSIIKPLKGLCRSNPSTQAFQKPLRFRKTSKIMLFLIRTMLAILIPLWVSLLSGCEEPIDKSTSLLAPSEAESTKIRKTDKAPVDFPTSINYIGKDITIAALVGRAENGDSKAQRNLGDYYSHLGEDASPRSKEKNNAEAVKWYRLAAEQGDATAQYRLALMHAGGWGVPQDDFEAVKWCRLAAEQGNAVAQTRLGRMYAAGTGVPKDATEAVRLFRLAAEKGYAPAQYSIGLMHRDGWGVPQDDFEAVRWYRLAAEQGDAAAQHNLGLHYWEGRGVPKSDAEAVKWYRLAAEEGSTQAHLKLAVIYTFGQCGESTDEAKARHHLMKVKEEGEELTELSERMRDDKAGLEARIAEVKQAIDRLVPLASGMTAQIEKDFFNPSHSEVYWDDERGRHIIVDRQPSDISDDMIFVAKMHIVDLRTKLATLLATKLQIENFLTWIRETDGDRTPATTSKKLQSNEGDKNTEKLHSPENSLPQAYQVFNPDKRQEIDRDLTGWSSESLLVQNEAELPPDVALLADSAKSRLKVWREAAEANVPSAQCLLGVCLFYGIECKADRAAGVAWLNKAASQVPRSENDKQIYAESQLMLGRAYLHEDNDELDNEMGIKALKKAAEFGSKRAFLPLGNYFFESGKSDSDVMKEVFSWYKQSAEAGSRVGMFSVAVAYEHGWGTTQNHSLAWQWMEKSANLGESQAEMGLGMYLLKGVGVDVDTATAASWVKRAADKEFAPAQFILAGMYLNGIGVQKSADRYVAWLNKSANNGDPGALEVLAMRYIQFNDLSFGEHLELAKGDPLTNIELRSRAYSEGMKYLRLAAINGSSKAQSLLEELTTP